MCGWFRCRRICPASDSLNRSPFLTDWAPHQLHADSIRSATSSRHATLTRDFCANLSSIERNSGVKDLPLNDATPVLSAAQRAQLRQGGRISHQLQAQTEHACRQQWASCVAHGCSALSSSPRKRRELATPNEFEFECAQRRGCRCATRWTPRCFSLRDADSIQNCRLTDRRVHALAGAAHVALSYVYIERLGARNWGLRTRYAHRKTLLQWLLLFTRATEHSADWI